jgi:hypothetical protein
MLAIQALDKGEGGSVFQLSTEGPQMGATLSEWFIGLSLQKSFETSFSDVSQWRLVTEF